MKALVVYESMYGNTHLVADAVAEGLGAHAEVAVLPVGRANDDVLDGIDLLVVGGPTHVHGLSRSSTRHAAVAAADKPGAGLELEPDAEGVGLRDWFDEHHALPALGAAFDTRIDAPAAVTGRASKGIAKRLKHHGCSPVVAPESFLVTKHNELLADEQVHAHAWGDRVGAAATVASAVGTRR